MSREVCNVCVRERERKREREGERERGGLGDRDIYVNWLFITGYCSFDSENREL